MSKFGDLKVKLRGGVSYVKKHWRAPPKGKYLSIREMAAYSVGGMGTTSVNMIPATYIALVAGVYLAAALKIKVDDIVTIGVISGVIGILRSPLISMLIDNTNTKYGKFRPYLIILPLPILLCTFLIGWIPPLIDSYLGMLIAFTVIYNVLISLVSIYTLAFTTLVQVISPIPEERTLLMSVGAFVYSLGPSLVTMIFPLAANYLYSEKAVINGVETTIMGINSIGPFQWLLPIITAICLALGLFVAFGTEERTVVSKKYVQRVKFFEGVKKSFENKYFWITNVSTALGVFRLIGTTFTIWICTYIINKEYAQTIAITLLGNACIPGMLLAPLLIKKFGKKNLTIFTNLTCIVFTIPIVFVQPSAASGYIILVCAFLITLFNSVQVVTLPAMTAQIYDYQQYRTGDRLEGFLSQFGVIITSAVGFGTAYIAPAVYKRYGYVDDTSVLYNMDVTLPIMRTMAIVGIASTILGTILYFFWDLSEAKHGQIMEVLKLRVLTEEGTVEADLAEELEKRIMDGEKDVLAPYTQEEDEAEAIVNADGEDTVLEAETIEDVETEYTPDNADERLASDTLEEDEIGATTSDSMDE